MAEELLTEDIQAMEKQELTYDAPQGLKQSTLQKTGYHFVGWNTKQDGSGQSYSDKETVSNLTADGSDITLYAQWEIDNILLKNIQSGLREYGKQSIPFLIYPDAGRK